MMAGNTMSCLNGSEGLKTSAHGNYQSAKVSSAFVCGNSI